jgi:hypothetical protein
MPPRHKDNDIGLAPSAEPVDAAYGRDGLPMTCSLLVEYVVSWEFVR